MIGFKHADSNSMLSGSKNVNGCEVWHLAEMCASIHSCINALHHMCRLYIYIYTGVSVFGQIMNMYEYELYAFSYD